jgi:hypothetical protein
VVIPERVGVPGPTTIGLTFVVRIGRLHLWLEGIVGVAPVPTAVPSTLARRRASGMQTRT